MAKRIYVGNLPFSATEDEVRQLFSEYGDVASVKLITDREWIWHLATVQQPCLPTR